jgi:potassium efflux system protein
VQHNPLTDPLFSIGDSNISLLGIVQFFLAVLSVIFIASLSKRFLKQHFLIKLRVQESNREVIATLASYGIIVFGLVIILDLSNLNLSSIGLIGGGLSLGIGFGFQDLTKNLLSGLTILMERKLKVGDYIESDNISGYIKEIAIRSTIIHTLQGGDVVIPNNELIVNKILNWSYSSYTGCIQIPVGVDYNSDPALVTEILLSCAYKHPEVLHDPLPKVLFIGFGDNTLNFELWIWVNRIDQGIFIKSDFNFAIKDSFHRRGIAIPFPQRDLWLRNPEAFSSLLEQNTQSFKSDNRSQNPPNSIQPKFARSSPPHLGDLLKKISDFKDYSEIQILQLIELGYRQYISASEIILNEGEINCAFYIILSGSVEIFINRSQESITILHDGDFFGAVNLLFEIPAYATVRALEETTLFTIPPKGFQKLLQEHPNFAETVIQKSQKKHEFLLDNKQRLKALGVLSLEEENQNPVTWLRTRLNKLFSSH